jgi:hypothetical protein
VWVAASRHVGASRSIARFIRDFDLSGAPGIVPRSGTGASADEGSGSGCGTKIQGGGKGGLSVGSTGGEEGSCCWELL